jgi:hypothetical protein
VKEAAHAVLYHLKARRHKDRIGVEVDAIRHEFIRKEHRCPFASNQTGYRNRDSPASHLAAPHREDMREAESPVRGRQYIPVLERNPTLFRPE